jgi:Na+/H+ antiporter NhaD/arsenite permease-like protein
VIAGTVTGFVILLFFHHPVHPQGDLRDHVEWDTLLFFAGLFVLVQVGAAMSLLQRIGDALATYIAAQEEDQQLTS